MLGPVARPSPALPPLATASTLSRYAIRLRFPTKPAYARVARQCAMRAARSLRLFTPSELIDLELAVGEGVANAIEHGRSEDGFFELRYYVAGSAFIIEIEDSGKGLELNDHGLPTRARADDRGLGVNIIRDTIDCTQFVRLETGTLLRLTKRMSLSSSARSRRNALLENLAAR